MKFQMIAMLLLLSLPAFGQTTMYENKSYGFTMTLPSTWKILEPGVVESNGVKENIALLALSDKSEIDVIVADMYASKGNENGEYSRKQIDDSFDKDTLSTSSESILKKMQPMRRDFHLFENSIVSLDGSMAILIRYSAQMPSMGDKGVFPKMIINEMLVRNGVMYSILASCNPGYYEAEKKTLAATISTFHVRQLPTSLLEAKAPPKKSGFFRNIFNYVVDNVVLNVFLWIVIGVIAGILTLVSLGRSFLRHRR
jgi:hypothetical protein